MTARIFLVASVCVIASLLALRAFASHLVVERGLGFALACVWPFLLAVAATTFKGVSIGSASPWGALVAITSLLVGGLTAFVLGLFQVGELPRGFAAMVLGVFFAVVVGVVCFGWWRLLIDDSKTPMAQSKVRSVMWVAFVATVVALLVFIGRRPARAQQAVAAEVSAARDLSFSWRGQCVRQSPG